MGFRLRQYAPVGIADGTATAARAAAGTAGQVAVAIDDAALPPGESDQTMTMVEVAPDGTTIARDPRRASTREQRYNELLRSAPPAAPLEAAPVEKPSLFQRMVTPIATALGMRPKQQPQPATVAAAQPRASEPRSRNETDPSRAPSSSTAATDTRQTPQDDGESDIMPPQLASAEFLPPQIHDGEETVFAAVINDNRSGVRSVSGVVASPSGSMQGFACTREGQTNRFVTRIAVPKDAPSGVWTVKYLTVSDNASNTATLNAAQGALPVTANFRVTSASADSTGPVLKALWVDKPAMRAGEKNTVFVQAEDDKTGVSLVNGVLVSPTRAARLGFGCRAAATGNWECHVTPPTCLDCGVWRLEQLQLHDKANNVTTLRADNQFVSGVTLDVSGDSCDSVAPVLTALSLSPTVVSNAEATVIQVHATVFDEGGCGVASLSAQAQAPGGVGGQRHHVTFDPSPDGQTFTGRLPIPHLAAKGEWSITWVQTLDKGHNLRMYSASEPILTRASFRVE